MSLDIDLECGCCGHTESFNITHNLGKMASAVGLYEPLWRGPETGIATAGQLVGRLREGIAMLKADPEKYRALEPENKWGTYAIFVPWLESLLEACESTPTAKVTSSP